MSIHNALACVAVTNLDDAIRWYEPVLQAAPRCRCSSTRSAPVGIQILNTANSARVRTAIVKDPDSNQIVFAQPSTDRVAR